ncbi:MAG TPA: EamA family transporter, partial [Rhabdochlamydiaceae bacterium]
MGTSLHKDPHIIKGALFALCGYLSMALLSACSKGLPSFSLMQILFFQNCISCILTLPKVTMGGGFKFLKTSHPYLHLTRDAAGLACFFSFFYAIKEIPLVNAVLFVNAAPLWLPFVIYFWLRKRVFFHIWLGIFLGLIGIILIIKPLSTPINLGVILGLASGMLFAITMVAQRTLSKTEPASRILFYYFFFGLIITTPFAVAEWQPFTLIQLLLFLGVGVFMYLSQAFMITAFTYAKASALSPLAYSAVIFSGILGWLIWGHIPD